MLKAVMKKSISITGAFVLIFFLSLLFAASTARAETAQAAKTRSLASLLNLRAFSLMEQKSSPKSETAVRSKLLKQVCVSVNRGLDAFLDLTSPYRQELRTRNSREDVRAVIGFHFLMR
jgi:hypothetical protein